MEQQIFDEQNAKIAELETALATEKEAHLATKQINEGLQQQIEELAQPATKAEKGTAKVTRIPTESFKVGNIQYVVTVPAFHYNGSKITAEQLLQDKKMQADLVGLGVGFIKRKSEK